MAKVKSSKSVLTENSLAFLRNYINNPSPTGFESGGQKIWLEYVKNFVDSTFTDAYGTAVGVIKVSPYPRTNFSFDKPSYCIPNATVTFNNTSTIEDGTENAFTYHWNFGDPGSGSNDTSVAKNPSHITQVPVRLR